MSERFEQMKNEMILANMKKKHKDISRHTPLIAFVGVILTSVIIISWTLLVI